jgi:hypothetical protein
MPRRCKYLIDPSPSQNISANNGNHLAPAAWAIRCNPSRGLWDTEGLSKSKSFYAEIVVGKDGAFVFLNTFERTINKAQMHNHLNYIYPQQMI